MGEILFYMQEVGGSSPSTRTKKICNKEFGTGLRVALDDLQSTGQGSTPCSSTNLFNQGER